jgi:hypothetical protein
MAKTRVLSVGLQPALIDFSDPAFAAFPGVNAEKVQAGLDRDDVEMRALGFEVDHCAVDYGATAETMLRDCLRNNTYDCIMVGAGVRLFPKNTALFEKLVNIVHEYAPKAKLCFNTGPTDSAAAVQRWFPQA